jgi:hypothetical protein
MAQSLSLTLEIILPVVVAAEASILALLLLSGPSLILLATPLSSCRSAPVLVCDCLTESEGRTLVHDFVSAKLTSQATNLSRGALVSNIKTIKLILVQPLYPRSYDLWIRETRVRGWVVARLALWGPPRCVPSFVFKFQNMLHRP